MKINLLLPLLLLLLLLLGGCVSLEDDFISKYCPGSCTVIKGRLTTENGTQPLAGVKLNVYWHSEQDYLQFGYSERRKAVAITDTDGNYELRFLLRDDELNVLSNFDNGYIVVAPVLEKDQYFICGEVDHILKTYELKRNTTTTLDYSLPRRAFLEIVPQNLQAMQARDAFAVELEIRSGKDNSQGCTSLFGFATTNAYQPVPVAANQPLTLRITKTKNGTTTETVETLNLEPGERLTYQPAF